MMPGKDVGTYLTGVFVLIATAEFLLLAGTASGHIGLVFAVTAHCALIATLTVWLRRNNVDDWALWMIGLLATALAGPLGAICVPAVAIIRKHTSVSQDLLDDWYRRMSGDDTPDPASLIHEAILTGRVVQPGASGSRRFLEIVKYGTLSEKQALLGLIGLKYHKSYFPILALALRSSEASVRAQAAAVFVKLKEQHKRRLLQSLSHPPAGVTALAASDRHASVSTILACVESGFIDASEVRNAGEVARTLCEEMPEADTAMSPAEVLHCRTLAAIGDHQELIGRLMSRRPVLTPDLNAMLANSLIRFGRHQELYDLLQTTNATAEPAVGRANDAGSAAKLNS